LNFCCCRLLYEKRNKKKEAKEAAAYEAFQKLKAENLHESSAVNIELILFVLFKKTKYAFRC
jgi:hypothetical protein